MLASLQTAFFAKHPRAHDTPAGGVALIENIKQAKNLKHVKLKWFKWTPKFNVQKNANGELLGGNNLRISSGWESAQRRDVVSSLRVASGSVWIIHLCFSHHFQLIIIGILQEIGPS